MIRSLFPSEPTLFDNRARENILGPLRSVNDGDDPAGARSTVKTPMRTFSKDAFMAAFSATGFAEEDSSHSTSISRYGFSPPALTRCRYPSPEASEKYTVRL